MSANISPSAHGRSWIFQVTALCIVLGMLLALSLKTQRQSAGVPNRLPVLKAEFKNTKLENEKLRKDLSYYKIRVDDLVKSKASDSKSKEFQVALEDAKVMAGTVPMVGPGLDVTLVDSPQRDPNETRDDIVEQYMVHDYDIRNVVNELFAAGAEAISVNGQRMVATSSIRCVGPVIMVNSEKLAPPYVIKVIGKPHDLETALKMENGAIEGLILLDMVKIEKQERVAVASYDGSTRFNLAKPVSSKAINRERKNK